MQRFDLKIRGFIGLLFILLGRAIYASPYSLSVRPKYIDLGDSVTIQYTYCEEQSSFRIVVISPSDSIYYLIPKKCENCYQAHFVETNDMGFLKENWNQYTIKLYNQRKTCVDSTSFFLYQKNKNLFFTVYVDDIGSAGYLDEDGEVWFKSLGAKINYGYQYDDWGGIPLGKILSKYNDSDDFVFHHFHASEFSGARIILLFDRFMEWDRLKDLTNGFLNIRLRNRYYILFCVLLIISAFVLWFSYKNRIMRIFLLVILAVSIAVSAAILSSSCVNEPNNRELKFYDTTWCMSFLKEMKHRFEASGLRYPEIVRHGWNISPRGLNKFYVTEMGVIADASLVYPKAGIVSQHPRQKDYGITLTRVLKFAHEWPDKMVLPTPYYTKLTGEVNSLWDSIEADRGLLEMPVTFENICGYGFDESDQEIIDRFPNGALVSTYVHPINNLRELEGIVSYIRGHYNITFVSARDYLCTYLKYNPRPILIDFGSKKAYWAYYGENCFLAISESNLVTFDDSTVIIHSVNYPPYVGIAGGAQNVMRLKEQYAFVGTVGDSICVYKLRNTEGACPEY